MLDAKKIEKIIRNIELMKWDNILSVSYEDEMIKIDFQDINIKAQNEIHPLLFIAHRLSQAGLKLNYLDYFYGDSGDTLFLLESEKKDNDFTLIQFKVSPYCNLEVWWNCPNGHTYKAKISEKTQQGIGCPECIK